MKAATDPATGNLAVLVVGVAALVALFLIVVVSALDARRQARQSTIHRGSWSSAEPSVAPGLALCLQCGQPIEGLTVEVELVPGCPVDVHAGCAAREAAR